MALDQLGEELTRRLTVLRVAGSHQLEDGAHVGRRGSGGRGRSLAAGGIGEETTFDARKLVDNSRVSADLHRVRVDEGGGLLGTLQERPDKLKDGQVGFRSVGARSHFDFVGSVENQPLNAKVVIRVVGAGVNDLLSAGGEDLTGFRGRPIVAAKFDGIDITLWGLKDLVKDNESSRSRVLSLDNSSSVTASMRRLKLGVMVISSS